MIYDAKDDVVAEPAEIVVGAGKLTAIFLAAAVVCGTCFGFGYSLGRRSSAKAAEAAVSPPTLPLTSGVTTSKPSPGSSASNADETGVNQAPASEDNVVIPASSQPEGSAKSAPAAGDSNSPQSVPSTAPGSHLFIVQVAAVSRPNDANILVGALQRKGYHATALPSQMDHLVHVQVGPFNNSKDAHAIQDRLSNDGYLAILK